MNKSVETQGKTIEAAIDEALAILGASYDEVDVDILKEAGFIKKAKVRVTLKTAATNVSAPEPKETVPADTAKHATPQIAQTKTEDARPQSKSDKKENASSGKEKPDILPQKAPQEKQSNGQLPKKFQTTLDFTTKLIELLGNEGEVTYETTDKSFNINVNGAGAGQIIGKGGEVLNAIQTLINSIAITNSNGEHMRVYFNVEDYKERRIETLKGLAVRKAEKVKETGRFIKLEPMNARDRAIIHSTLQEISGIRTYSTGKEPYRCLCIAPARKEEQDSGN